ncbi:hypothetical protein CEXT_437961 [Caerostris extrusa]|uniref:Uncharacterized protein n=1 Tax=Caerostris extrusa TaxID=172846 RepID=A0AAV4MM76_CAEEX|nr:hypothetical protein CEXT_437961 [Caerostris extrusa]
MERQGGDRRLAPLWFAAPQLKMPLSEYEDDRYQRRFAVLRISFVNKFGIPRAGMDRYKCITPPFRLYARHLLQIPPLAFGC